MTTNRTAAKVSMELPYAALDEKVRLEAEKWAQLKKRVQLSVTGGAANTDGRVDPFQMSHLLEQLLSDSTVVAVLGDQVLHSAKAQALADASAALARFDEELHQLCREKNWSISGRFPNYTVCGYLSLRIAADHRGCEVGTHKVDTLLFSRIGAFLTSEIDAETKRRTDPTKFLELLFSAYRRSVAVTGGASDAAVPIKQIYREVVVLLQPDTFWRTVQRSRLIEYTDEHFRRDLTSLVSSSNFISRDGFRLDLLPTAFPKDGMQIFADGGTRYVGKIKFEENKA